MNSSSADVARNLVTKNERKRQRKEHRKTAELQRRKEAEERMRLLRAVRPELEELEKRLELDPSLKLTRKDRKLFESYYNLSGESTTRPRTADEAKARDWKEWNRFCVISDSQRLSTIFWNHAGIHLDFSPSSLELIDSTPFVSSLRGSEREENWGWTGVYYYYYLAVIGSYFGMVIVRNLGGEWRYPSRLLRTVALKFLRAPWFLDKYFVIVDRKKIPVMKIVRLWGARSDRKYSLAETYKRISSGESWRPHRGIHEKRQ